MEPAASGPDEQQRQPGRSRRGRQLLRKLVLAVVVGVVVLKPADLLLGWLADTHTRHLLRIDPYANARHRSAEFDYQFHTNALGLRGPDRPLGKAPGTRRLVVVGDSFVAGVGVDYEHVFTTRLEQRLRQVDHRRDVINVGRAGSSTIRELTLYEQRGRGYRPDVVLLVFYLGNDLAEVLEEEDSTTLAAWHPDGFWRRAVYAWCPNFYLELAIRKRRGRSRRRLEPRTEAEILATIATEATRRRGDPDAANAAVQRYHRFPAEVRQLAEQGRFPEYRVLQACVFPDRFRDSIDPDDKFVERAWPQVERHLDLFRRAVEADGATLLMAVIPDAIQVDADAFAFNRQLGFDLDPRWLDGPPGRTASLVRNWAREANVPLLELITSLRRSDERTFFVQDGHCNPSGHEQIARALAEWDPLTSALATEPARGSE